MAESELTAYGTGELVVVFIEPQDHARKTRIEVISKRITPPLLPASAERNWALDILNQLDGNLKHSSGH